MGWLKDLFLPHRDNNHKAHLIRSHSLLFLSASFAFLQIFLNFFLLANPAVLGFSSNITPEKIIELTNSQRGQKSLGLLKENKLLSEAARQKAADMFAFNYWAHVSPSGRTPWAFFKDVGYRYQYAGENLARDFTEPGSAVNAWMDSPAHRDNVLNPNYQEIGVAVVEGSLQGVETALVVQFFGAPYGVALPPVTEETGTLVPAEEVVVEEAPVVAREVLARSSVPAPLTSPLDLTKGLVILFVGVLIGVFAADLLLVSQRHTARFSSRSLAQLFFLFFVLGLSLWIKQGAIL